jgi:hypothetical protein
MENDEQGWVETRPNQSTNGTNVRAPSPVLFNLRRSP